MVTLFRVLAVVWLLMATVAALAHEWILAAAFVIGCLIWDFLATRVRRDGW